MCPKCSRQLEEDANGDMQKNVEEHTQQLQTQINRLKAILQVDWNYEFCRLFMNNTSHLEILIAGDPNW